MTEADVIQPSASIASTGKGIRYVGNHVWAHSGSISVTNATTTMLSFHTSATSYILAKITIGSKAGHGDNMDFSFEFNGEQVYSAYEALVSMPTQRPLNILIPPDTFVEIKASNKGSTTGRLMECVIVGRVYGAV